MRFEYRHTFDVGVEELIASFFDAAMTPHLAEKMTTIVSVEVLERTDDDGSIKRKVKYVPVPLIKRIGPKKIPPEAMQWVEESEFDRRRLVMTFKNIPSHPQIRARMTNEGQIEFRSLGEGRSERIMSGELKIRFPILGKIAEKIIAKNGEKILNEEASVLRAWMVSKGS